MSWTPLSRRTVLKGLGASLALPLLEGMAPKAVRAAGASGATPPVRMAFVFFPNGCIVPSWRPEGAGKDFEFGPTHAPLSGFKSEINIFSGLAQDNGRAKGDGPGDHARCASTYLTGVHPVKTSGADIKVGMSVDQIAAEQIGKLTRLPSLEIGIERGRTAGSCDSGYSCAYSSAVSWKTPTTPMAKEISPRGVFERMFGNEQEEAGRAKRLAYRKSILDMVADDAQKLKEKLGETDRRKVDEYFSSVREIESRIERAEKFVVQERPKVDVPEGMPRDVGEHIRLMYDMLALAFQTDTTRVATFMLGNAGSNRSYPMVDVNSGHHQLSHHRNDKDKVAQLERIDKYLVSQFAYFLERLDSIAEGEKTLLHNSMVMYGSGLSDGNRHQHDDLPIIVAGRGGGTIQTGRHVTSKSETPLNNLFLSMLDRVGAKVESFGDSSGRLKTIDA